MPLCAVRAREFHLRERLTDYTTRYVRARHGVPASRSRQHYLYRSITTDRLIYYSSRLTVAAPAVTKVYTARLTYPLRTRARARAPLQYVYELTYTKFSYASLGTRYGRRACVQVD